MKRNRVQIPPIRKKDGTWAHSEQEKAKIYARYLENVFIPNTIGSELDILQCQPLNATREKIKHFSPLEITKVDNNFNPKKSQGYDEIIPKILI